MQCISHIGAPDNIDLKHNCLTTNIEEDTRYTTSDEPIVSPNNNNIILTLLQPIMNEQEIPSSEGSPVSEVIECKDY